MFEGKAKKDRSALILSVVAVLAGAGTFAGTYFLTKEPETAQEATAEAEKGTEAEIPAENGEKAATPAQPGESTPSPDSAETPAPHGE